MNIFYFLLSFLLFLAAPGEYSFLFCIALMVLFFIQTLPFVIKISKGNYISFYTLFFFSFFFVNFFYPIVLYPIDPFYFSVFNHSFNELFINKGTALAQVSVSSFILGVNTINTIKEKKRFTSNFSYKPVLIFSICLFILFVLTVGSEFLMGNFIGQSNFSLYILQLLTSSLILTTIIFYRNPHKNKHKWLFYTVVVIYVIIFLRTGDRGPALSLMLLIFGLYAHYRKHIKLKLILPLALIGMGLMYLIGLGRTTEIDNIEGNVISRGIQNTQSSGKNSFFEMTGGFVVNTRNLYAGLEYVDREGINFGKTYLGVPFSVIPFGQSFFENLTNMEVEGSASFFTYLVFGNDPPYGLGTNLVADVYITFGLIGSIFLFFLFGRTVEYFRISTTINNDIFSVIAYFTLLSYGIYYPRTSLFLALKFIVWTYVIFYIFRAFNLLKIIDNEK